MLANKGLVAPTCWFRWDPKYGLQRPVGSEQGGFCWQAPGALLRVSKAFYAYEQAIFLRWKSLRSLAGYHGILRDPQAWRAIAHTEALRGDRERSSTVQQSGQRRLSATCGLSISHFFPLCDPVVGERAREDWLRVSSP